ncbi:hypothetical protein OIU34_26600 [Pararhizobium sp. BT-229]|uniref:hypothetical protein n=1 Tax=Pararhizobium sp. BT-229 TaxID=2986923 RepID=UPI0021F6C458|nr:hypothetical protein [Pararhizobium sp. BT-229]MCV9965453.1 hypothetical protein [Pararhizobium sp. BT-229]
MKTTQQFNETGIKGVMFWIAGPLVSGAGYVWALSVMAEGGDFPMLAVLMVLGGSIGTLAALPMMIVGREFYREAPRDSDVARWSS